MAHEMLLAPMQPYMRLAQANADLLVRFSASPEVANEAMSMARELYQQTSGAALKLMQSHAFVELTQGMLKNYLTFLGELGQHGMTALTEGQAAVWQHAQQAQAAAQDATDQAIETTRRVARGGKG